MSGKQDSDTPLRFYFLTIYPEMIRHALDFGTLRQAASKGLCTFQVINLRDFAVDRHGTVDDRPYGGGDGMILRPEPVVEALESIPGHRLVIYPCPQGRPFSQSDASRLSRMQQEQRAIVMICGRFGGMDQRVIDSWVDETYSAGDYILGGGEFPSLMLTEAVSRLIPGVLGNRESAEVDSFSDHYAGGLEGPQYTRPPVFRGHGVPPQLLSGNHAATHAFRLEHSRRLTAALRPDLLPPRTGRNGHGTVSE